MKVLIINGSPKGQRSNSFKLAKGFADGAGYADAQVLNVFSEEIAPCRGCFACWNKTPGKCVIKDSMQEILNKIIETDVLIWSFPLYYFSVPGSLKNLLDRLLPLCLPFMSGDNQSGGHFGRYDLAHQRRAVISTCGFWTAEGNYKGVRAIFDRLYDEDGYAKIFCGQGELFRVPELKDRTDAYLDLVRVAGAEFAATGKIDCQTQQELNEPLFDRRTFENMADASWGIENTQGQPVDESLAFTKQMAALYKPDGKERVLQFDYTDIGKSYQLLLTAHGSRVLTDSFHPLTTKIETPFSVWKSIAKGEISGQEALYKHLYRVTGDFSVMLDWDKLFGTAPVRNAKVSTSKPYKTNMLILLIPWIIFWSVVPIDVKWGSIVSIIAASLVPVAWCVYKPVTYERTTVTIVTALALFAIFDGDIRVLMPASYGIFGAMWLLSGFLKIPLTAYYSANDYGFETAFKNPLFISTNRILTIAWGILYLFTAVWTYALMGTAAAPYSGLINTAAPLLMGAFTAWFQKWYPAKYARSG